MIGMLLRRLDGDLGLFCGQMSNRHRDFLPDQVKIDSPSNRIGLTPLDRRSASNRRG